VSIPALKAAIEAVRDGLGQKPLEVMRQKLCGHAHRSLLKSGIKP